jgi:hypothetical protein
MRYINLSIMSRIGLKGVIRHRELRPNWFTENEHNYFDALNALWIITDFPTAVQHFFITD